MNTATTQATATISASRLVCRDVRDFLAKQQFIGKKIRWIEGSGFLWREFVIRGDAADVTEAYDVLVEALGSEGDR